MLSRRRARPRAAPFTRLWLAAAVSDLGDGVTLAAGPLLTLALTDDPLLVAATAFAQRLPWLLASPLTGVLVDRLDRRTIVLVAQAARGLLLTGLAAATATGHLTIGALLAVLFLHGLAETFADPGATALVADLVPDADLPRANARVQATRILGNQLAGKPLGAWLFTLAAAAPFGFDAASYFMAAALVATLPRAPASTPPAGRGRLRGDVAEGMRWIRRQPTVRALTVCIGAMDLTFMIPFAVWPLYVTERLGLGPVGFGVLLTAGALGGLAGSVVVDRRPGLPPAAVLRTGLVVETATHVVLAITTSPAVAFSTMTVFGVHAAATGAVSLAVRQRLTPRRLLGRTLSTHELLSNAGAAAGTVLGGVVANAFGLTAGFWIAAAGMAVTTAVVWPHLDPSRSAAGPAAGPQG